MNVFLNVVCVFLIIEKPSTLGSGTEEPNVNILCWNFGRPNGVTRNIPNDFIALSLCKIKSVTVVKLQNMMTKKNRQKNSTKSNQNFQNEIEK